MNEYLSPDSTYTVSGIHFSYPENQFYETYRALTAHETHHVLLESGKRGRFSIALLHPTMVLTEKEGQLQIQTRKETIVKEGDPLQVLFQWLSHISFIPNKTLPDFQGGVVGVISYDYGCGRKQESAFPLLYFVLSFRMAVFDHHEKQLYLMVVHDEMEKKESVEKRLQEEKKKWQHPPCFTWNNLYKKQPKKRKSSFSAAAFEEAVHEIKTYIAHRETKQVNISIREEEPLLTPPLHIYEKLREMNPSPYMGYFHTPHFQIVSASPELLMRKRGDEIVTRPIGGTRPRGKGEEEDQLLEKELVMTKKEREEHEMLIEVERADFEKICEKTSIQVDEKMVVERYSHVMHLVSNIVGKLKDKQDVYGMMKAVFPGGTITGIPKEGTMEIIDKLEPVPRGFYTGSLGWIGFQQDAMFNILIRTLLAKDGTAFVQAGAGVVEASDAKAEYMECLRKAEALWKAKEMSERELLE